MAEGRVVDRRELARRLAALSPEKQRLLARRRPAEEHLPDNHRPNRSLK